jgi:hypothetical protein
MNSNDSSNGDSNQNPGVLTRAQRKKLAEENKQNPETTDINIDDLEKELEELEDEFEDELEEELEESKDYDGDNEEYGDYSSEDEINDSTENYSPDNNISLDNFMQNPTTNPEGVTTPLDDVVIDFVSKYLAHSIAQKIQDVDGDIYEDTDLELDEEEDEEEDDEEEENLDENGYYKGDGFVVPDDYDSDEDDDYKPSTKDMKQLKKDKLLNKKVDDAYQTDNEDGNEADNEFANSKAITKLPSIFDMGIFKKPSMTMYKMNKEEAGACQQYFDIMKTYGKTSAESYFMKLDINDKKKVIEQEKCISSQLRTDTPLRFQILNSNLPDYVKAMAISKVNVIDNDRTGNDFYKLKEWLDGLMRIPFGKIVNMPVTLFSPPYQIRDFINQSSRILDEAIYGQNDTKTHVIQIISQLISNPESIGNVFSIYGPMGTGKTSLVQKGIAKALNRPFTLVSLGGMTDSSFFRGHSYTYEGARPGRIIDILKESQCMNPIIYFDELDKVSDTPKGEEIINTLIHLTDKSQNMHFQDSYYSGISTDISKTIFIFSYNDENKINPILKDRMYKIAVKGFGMDEKVQIAKNYLLNDIYKNFNFNQSSIFFPDDVIKYIINVHTKDDFDQVEEGVRNLERCLETIVSKINVLRLMQNKNDTNNSFANFPIDGTGLNNPNQIIEKIDDNDIDIDDDDGDLRLEIEKSENSYQTPYHISDLHFPLIITASIVDKFLKAKKGFNPSHNMMYT